MLRICTDIYIIYLQFCIRYKKVVDKGEGMRSYNTIMVLWISTLTFTGAYINSMAIMRYSISVGNVTGNWNIGIQSLSFSNFKEVFFMFDVIFSFFAGTIISGIVFSDETFLFKKKYENYLLGLGIALFIATVLLSNSEKLKYIVAIIVGMQNGMFITYRNVTCRTTHLTGITTEIGTQIGKFFKGKADVDRMKFGFINIFMALLGIAFGARTYMLFKMKGFYFASLGYFLSAYICKKIREKYFITAENKESELKKKYMKL